MIRTVTLNPALDKTAQVPGFALDQVNRIQELRRDAGGKGINVSKVVAQLGGTSEAWALLGGSTGHAIAEALDQDGIQLHVFEVEGETRTNLKVVDPQLGTHTDINEPGPQVTDQQLDQMLDEFVDTVQPGDIVVLSGSLPRGAADDTYARWVRACKESGAQVFLDADGQKFALGLKAAPSLVKPNEIELGDLLGRKLQDDQAVVEAARELVAQGVEHVMVSMGGAGAVYTDATQAFKASPVKVPVGSTVGAGDSVVAALAYALDQGMPLQQTLALAMATGAANVMQSGTQAAPRQLVDSLVPKVVVTPLA